MNGVRRAEAKDLMMRFADRTGLTSDRPSRRYLWTDAFAVCNLLELARASGEAPYRALTLRLIDEVHHELGRHRTDDPRRSGWISGLSDVEAEAHPTRGGLRIGKPLPERTPNETPDADLEWDRDGQYFHYLTKWMHALDQVARWTHEAKFNVWARELADAAHRAFVYGPSDNRRMMWKLSIDLRRPLVASMGQHDPLDGYVTCKQLEATAAALGPAAGPSLRAATVDFAGMLDREQLMTSDPLGIGGLLADASRLRQLESEPELVASLLAAAVLGLRRYRIEGALRAPVHRRLAFRELGLAIGLAAVETMEIEELSEYMPLRAEIESFWMRPEHRRTEAWVEHLDINEVMLATSLCPEGFTRALWG
jgi:hypothetical protein